MEFDKHWQEYTLKERLEYLTKHTGQEDYNEIVAASLGAEFTRSYLSNNIDKYVDDLNGEDVVDDLDDQGLFSDDHQVDELLVGGGKD